MATIQFWRIAEHSNALRTRVELAQAGRFNELAFHDFIVNQGLLPFDLLEQAVLAEFAPAKQ